jgi:hypothetical protein
VSLLRVTSVMSPAADDNPGPWGTAVLEDQGDVRAELLVYNGLEHEVYPGELVRAEPDADGDLVIREIIRKPAPES